MPRTTLNIDAPVLEDLKKLQKRERASLGELVSRLLVEALAGRRSRARPARKLKWHSMDMGAPRVELEDRQAVWTLMDSESHGG